MARHVPHALLAAILAPCLCAAPAQSQPIKDGATPGTPARSPADDAPELVAQERAQAMLRARTPQPLE